jgi:hypothetical protein
MMKNFSCRRSNEVEMISISMFSYMIIVYWIGSYYLIIGDNFNLVKCLISPIIPINFTKEYPNINLCTLPA